MELPAQGACQALQVLSLHHKGKGHRQTHLMICAFYAWLEHTLQQADWAKDWHQEDAEHWQQLRQQLRRQPDDK